MLYNKNKKTEVKRNYDYLSVVNHKIALIKNARKLGKTKLNGAPKNKRS